MSINSVIFILGIVVAIIMILIIVTVIILLKIKKIPIIERSVDDYQIDNNLQIDEIYRQIESKSKDYFDESKRYTDSRFDKTVELLKK